MKDENKTRAQLIEELTELRTRAAEVDVAAGRQKQVMVKVREQIWQMQREEDIDKVLVAIREGLDVLEISFQEFGVNIIDAFALSTVSSHRMGSQEEWIKAGPERGSEIIHQIWHERKPAYRQDLTVEDHFQEKSQIESIFGHPVRSVLDVPFSHGTLAINHSEPNAFSDSDIRFLQELAEGLSEGFRRLDDLKSLEKRTQEAEEKAQLLVAFYRIGQIILSSLDLGELLDNLPQQIIKAGLFRSLMVSLVDEPNRCIKAVLGFRRHEDGAIVRVEGGEIGGPYSLEDQDIVAETVRTGEMQIAIEWDDRFTLRPDIRPEDRKGQVSYFIPVKQGERVLAVLATGSPIEKKEETLHRIEVMTPLLDQFAIALEHARLFETTRKEISERKQAEKALRESEERYRSLFENMGNGFALHEMVFDEAGTPVDYIFLDVNDAFERQTDLKREDLIGEKVTEVLPGIENDPTDWIGTYGKVVLTGESTSFENFSEALQRWYSIIAYRPKEGLFAVIFTDITDRKRMEEELGRANNLESLGFLAGGIAHDFNNVLTGVIGNLSLLEIILDEESEPHEIVAEAITAADKTKALTQQLLTFARGGAPAKETASIEELLKETAELSLHGSNTKAEYHFSENLFAVDVDSGQLGQVIQNLVLNADQAMPTGGILEISADNVEIADEAPLPLAAGRYVKVSVEDQGIGIPKKILGKVFDPYFSTKTAGHGLGLAISHSIIRRHDGFITVHSEVDVGTTFEFYLPASKKQTVAVAAQKRQLACGTGRILLMDDEQTIHTTVGRLLEELGYQVESVYDVNEALQVYKASLETESPYDVVITDLTIPGGMGGKEAVTRLHEIDPQACVIVSSGYANDPVMANFADYGFADRLTKPVGIQELAKTLKRVLEV